MEQLRRVTASGYFGLCDSCGADIEGRPVTYYVEDVRPLPDVGGTAHRYHCAACAKPTAPELPNPDEEGRNP